MNREEKHQLVCQLYKEGKTMREIAKEAHMSFGDIGSIIKKVNEELEPKNTQISKETQALKLLKKGKDPVDVAILLDISPSKAEGIYKQFWKLRGLYKLHDLYEMVKDDISLLGKVHDLVKRYNLTRKDIVNIVNWADQYKFLKEEIQELEAQFKDLLKQRRVANDALMSVKKQHEELLKQIDKYTEINIRKSSQIEDLNNEIKKLENQISLLRNGDEYYAKFEQTAREKLELIMKERKWILALAIDTVIESMKQVQFKEMIINDSITDEINQQKLLDLCEVLFDKMLKQLIDESMPINIIPEIKHDILTSDPSLSESESNQTRSVLELE